MSTVVQSSYLPEGLPSPVVEPDGLSKPYRDALAKEELHVQRCGVCQTWQWGPEWLCHRCHSFDMRWERVAPRGRIYSWARCWHPVHRALKEHGPYLAVLVELPDAGWVRMLGNLLGDPLQAVTIGAEVKVVFEHHPNAAIPYSLAQWQLV